LLDNGNGTVTYTHNGTGFTYTVNDGTSDSNTATVSITVTPVNDSPVITSANNFNVNENIANSTVVYSATATDAESNSITWSIVDSNSIFAVSASGVVTVSNNTLLNFETFTPYNIQLTATDNGVPAGITPISILVTVNDINEAPSLVATPASQTIQEDANVADAITSVVATDPEGDSHNWSISIGNDDGIFGIDASGNVTIVNTTLLNFETSTQHILTIRAEDTTDPLVFETINVTVDVTDVLENQVLSPVNGFGADGESVFNTYSLDVVDSVVKTLRQSDGKFVLVANTDNGGVRRIAVTRLNPDGSVDTSYGINGINILDSGIDEVAKDATLDNANDLYITGYEDDDAGGVFPIVLKVVIDGTLDNNFDSDGKVAFSFPNNTDQQGQAILHHSSGELYIAADGLSSTLSVRALKLIRIDVSGNIVSLTADGGLAEYDLFTSNFFPEALAELSTGELVVMGHENGNGATNIAATVITEDNFLLSPLISANFNIGQLLGAFNTEDYSTGFIDLANDSYIITGSSDFVNGGSSILEAMLLKIDVTTSAITRNLTFANNGVFNVDIDSNAAIGSSILGGALDSADSITYIAESVFVTPGYFVEKLNSLGSVDIGFTSQTYPVQSGQPGATIIVEPTNDNFYLSYNTFIGVSEDIFFQQLLNNGSEVTTTNNTLSFTSSDEFWFNMALLTNPMHSSKLLLVNDKDLAMATPASSITLLNNNGSQDHTLNNGNSTLTPSGLSYGPTLELSDGSIFITTLDPDSLLTVHKYSNTNFVHDVNFVPGTGFADVALSGSVQIEDIQYDALTDHIIVVGTQNDSGPDAFIAKINATNGALYNGGNFSAGLVVIDVTGGSNDDTLQRVLPQVDGSYIGLGVTNIAGNNMPYLMKVDGNGNFVNSFDTNGYKTNFGLSTDNYVATDIVQLTDTSIIFSTYDVAGTASYMVKTDSDSNLDATFATAGVLSLSQGASGTFIGDITLDANDDIYGVGYAMFANEDALLVKVNSTTGTLDPLLNAFTTQGFWLIDDGANERFEQIVFDGVLNRFLLGDTTLGPVGSFDLRVRAFNLIQDDN